MFDTNDMVDGVRYWLGFPQSSKDLEAIRTDERDGLRVVIYMPGELEMEATLEFDVVSDAWTARPINGTLKLYPESLFNP